MSRSDENEETRRITVSDEVDFQLEVRAGGWGLGRKERARSISTVLFSL
jgi:hypothetical protein